MTDAQKSAWAAANPLKQLITPDDSNELYDDFVAIKAAYDAAFAQAVLDGYMGTEEQFITLVTDIYALKEQAETSADEAADSAALAQNNILNGVDTHNTSETSHPSLLSAIQAADSIARGRATSCSFDTYEQLTAWLAGTYVRADGKTVADLVGGDNLYIRDTGVPDYWWDADTQTIQELEAECPDLTDYYLKTQVDALLPVTIEQTDYDALVAAGTLVAGKIYYVVPDGTLP